MLNSSYQSGRWFCAGEVFMKKQQNKQKKKKLKQQEQKALGWGIYNLLHSFLIHGARVRIAMHSSLLKCIDWRWLHPLLLINCNLIISVFSCQSRRETWMDDDETIVIVVPGWTKYLEFIMRQLCLLISVFMCASGGFDDKKKLEPMTVILKHMFTRSELLVNKLTSILCCY